ncbi:MAG: hypothetical protein RIT27_1544 [Pseudomonadota bacterium]
MIRQIFRLIRDKLHNLVGSKKTPAPIVASPPPAVIKSAPPRPKQPAWKPDQYLVEPVDGKTRFHDFNLSYALMHAIADADFRYCTPIQADTLPHTLQGKDMIGQAQTGTGKTAAFMITIIQRLVKSRTTGKRPNGTPRALILAPTRELVIQIIKDTHVLTKYLHLKTAQAFGGTDYRKQQSQLNEVIDILVATPGRLLDFQKQKLIDLSNVEILVLDEADRMLDMGFLPDVRQIVRATPYKDKRQTLLFSATFPDEIRRAAEGWTTNPITVSIEPEHLAAQNIKQIIYITTNDQKYRVLYNLIVQQNLQRVLIFANRRDETRHLTDKLRHDNIQCAMLSGDVAQDKRIKTLESFRNGKIRVLVATDVAGRGLHIDAISHVINFTLPDDPEDYVHRIGRTGRAGALGTSISFATEDDAFRIPEIEQLIGYKFECIQPDDNLLRVEKPISKPAPKLPNKPAAKIEKPVEKTSKEPVEEIVETRFVLDDSALPIETLKTLEEMTAKPPKKTHSSLRRPPFRRRRRPRTDDNSPPSSNNDS